MDFAKKMANIKKPIILLSSTNRWNEIREKLINQANKNGLNQDLLSNILMLSTKKY